MWIAKGFLLGIWVFTFGSIAFLCFTIIANMRKMPPLPPGRSGEMMPPGMFTHLTVSNPVWWLALIACLSIALIITHSWPGWTILWIGLAVTELVPVGFLTWILVTMNRLPRLGTR